MDADARGDGTSRSVEILEEMQAVAASLSPQLRRAAAYLLDRPDEIAFTSMRQLAERAGVQPATMVRLAQRLGFEGYDEFRVPFRDALRYQPSGYGSRARQLLARTGRKNHGRALARLANEMIASDRENLSLSLEAIGSEEMAQAATVLANARRLFVVGQRSLFPAAYYVHYACSMFRTNVVLLDGAGGTFADPLRGIGPEDAVLAFAYGPYSRGSVMAARYAVEHGAAVVAVTDSVVSPLAALTPHILLVGTDTPAMFKSVVPALSVAQVLVAQILAQGGQDALSAVAESERQLDTFGAYWPEGAVPEVARPAAAEARRDDEDEADTAAGRRPFQAR